MVKADSSPAPRRPALEVLVFAVVAYLITWSAGSLILISNHSDLVSGIGNPSPALKLPTGLAGSALFLSDMGPALAAVLTVALFIGRPGVGRLFKQFTGWRIGWSWYTLGLVGPTALSLLAVAGFVVLGGRMDPAGSRFNPAGSR